MPTTTVAATRALFRNEARLLLRSPGVLIWTIILPLTALVVLTAVPATRRPLAVFGGLSVVQAYQPTLMVFAATILALQMMPMMLGQYREFGFLRRLRTTPASPWQLLGALIALLFGVAMLVGLIMVVVPLVTGVGALARVPAVVGVLALMSVAFLAVGAMIAAVIPSSRVAGGAGAALAAVMWFFAGMWFPRAQFPAWLARIAEWTPGGAAATAMTDAAIGLPLGWQPFACLAIWIVVALVVAVRAFRWE